MSRERKNGELELSLSELAERSGTPPRTIRFYIARGLLAGPLKAGRGAVYGQEHLDRLAEIRDWQSKGLTLTEVGRRLAGEDRSSSFPGEPLPLLSYQIAPEVTVQVQANVSPWRLRQIQRVLREAASLLAGDGGDPDDNQLGGSKR
jgi:DNA-binding transcriptional MerR regulator